jgi:hypothetical protein
LLDRHCEESRLLRGTVVDDIDAATAFRDALRLAPTLGFFPCVGSFSNIAPDTMTIVIRPTELFIRRCGSGGFCRSSLLAMKSKTKCSWHWPLSGLVALCVLKNLKFAFQIIIGWTAQQKNKKRNNREIGTTQNF